MTETTLFPNSPSTISIKIVVDEKTIDRTVPFGSTLRSVLIKGEEDWVFSDGVDPFVSIALIDDVVIPPELFETWVMQEGDTIELIPLMAGG